MKTIIGWAEMGRHRGAIAALLAGVATSCDVVQHTDTKTTPEYVISLTVGTYPLIAGDKLDVFATLRRERSAMSGCRVRFDSEGGRSATPTDGWDELAEQGQSGVYRKTVVIAATPGKWATEVAVKCLGPERRIAFEFDVIEKTG